MITRAARIEVPAGPARRYYRHGWHSFSPARWVDPGAPRPLAPTEALRIGGDDPVYAVAAAPEGGSAVGALAHDDGTVTLLGALGLGARVRCEAPGLVGCVESPAPSRAAPPGAAQCDPPEIDWLIATGTEAEVFDSYARELGARFGARPGPGPRLWTSWYSLYGEIDERRLAGVLDSLDGFAFDTVAIDDGWQRAIGDWEAGDRFGAGMAAFAARIAATGRRPGLWLAPFIARPGSRLLREHPDWFVRDDAGELAVAGYNWGGAYHGLDLSQDAVLEHVGSLARTIVGWGFGLLKLDFLFGAAVPGRRERAIGREEAYRQGVQAIREAAGDEVFLLACGAPIVASLGVFDGIRIGPDVAPWWENPLATHLGIHSEPGTRDAIVTSLHRLWLAPLIAIDPDVVYVGARWQALTREQQGLLMDLARICDAPSSSDLPAELDPDERARLAELLTQRPRVRRLGGWRFAIDGREVDFSAVVGD